MNLTFTAFGGAAGAGGSSLGPKYGGFKLDNPSGTSAWTFLPRLKDTTSGTVLWHGDSTSSTGPALIQMTDSNGTGSYTLDWSTASVHQQDNGSWPWNGTQYIRNYCHYDSSGNVYVWNMGFFATNPASDGFWVYKFNGSNGALSNRVLITEPTTLGYNDPPVRGGFIAACTQGDSAFGPYLGFHGLSGSTGHYKHGVIKMNTDLTIHSWYNVGEQHHHADSNIWISNNPPANKIGLCGGQEYSGAWWMIGQWGYSGTTRSRDGEVKESTQKVIGQASCFDTSNNLICSGGGALGSWSSTPNYTENFLAKFNSSGTEQWTIKFEIADTTLECAFVASDTNDNLIAAYKNKGVTSGSGANTGDVLIKFNGSNGSIAWAKQMSLGGQFNRFNTYIATDSSDDIFFNYVARLVVIPGDGVGATGQWDSAGYSISDISSPSTSSAGITWNSYTNRTATTTASSAYNTNTSFPVTTSNPSFNVATDLTHTSF